MSAKARLIRSAAADGRYERDRATIQQGGGQSAAVANVFIPYEDIRMLADLALFGQDAITQTGVRLP